MPKKNSKKNSKKPWEWPQGYAAQSEYLTSIRPKTKTIIQIEKFMETLTSLCFDSCYFPLPLREVYLCGSVGKGTSHVSTSDLDVVLYFQHPAHTWTYEETYLYVSDILKSSMQQQGFKEKFRKRKSEYPTNPIRYGLKGLKIDVLIGFWSLTPQALMRQNEYDASFLSASLSRFRVDFISRQEDLYKDCVRVIKDWRNSLRWTRKGKPKSYLLEIIMLHAYVMVNPSGEDSGSVSGNEQVMEKTLQTFFDLVSRMGNEEGPKVCLCFEEFYLREDIDLLGVTQYVYNDNVYTATAIVMDPVDPTNNLWRTLGTEFGVFVKRAAAMDIHGTRDV